MMDDATDAGIDDGATGAGMTDGATEGRPEGAGVAGTPGPGRPRRVLDADELALRDAADRALLERPREQMNDAERAYLEARDHLVSGRKPSDAGNAVKWERGTLRITPTAVAREAGFAREPIAGDEQVYGYIYRLIRRDGANPVERSDLPPELGTRGYERSIQQLRSHLVAMSRRLEIAERKAEDWDRLASKVGTAAAGGRRGRRSAGPAA